MDQTAPDVSVVVPVYNEQGNVLPLAEEVAGALRGRLNYELVFVDDASNDLTADEITTAAAANERVRQVRHDRNRGQSAAVRSGVKAARAAVIAVLDGDGQNDPRDIPKLYGHLAGLSSVGLVIGERRNRRDGWLRKFSSRVANGVRSRVLGDGVPDTGCGIKVFYRDQYLDLPAFNHMHRFLPALMQASGRRVCSLPVNHRPRWNGESKYGVNNRLWVGIVDLAGVLWLQHRRL